jgi:hypothetical protein
VSRRLLRPRPKARPEFETREDERDYLLVYQLMPRIEIQPHEMLFTRCFDVLQLFDGLHRSLYVRKHRAWGQLDV